ncbi:hypothetical protein [Mycolicibacterium vaccae]|uniref:aa3-type cytochrome oxidase subunit CtaJ n=1 Tax=Mycolicibacterium vaccae TaxID=1810 RepID=UPI003CEF41D6
MNDVLIHASYVLVPLALAGVLALFIYREKDPHPATYDMSERWTHDPILWAAEEPRAHGHGHGSHLTIGGGASGKW